MSHISIKDGVKILRAVTLGASGEVVFTPIDDAPVDDDDAPGASASGDGEAWD